MVSVFCAAGVCLCVCRLIEFYLRLDSQREAPRFRSPAEGLCPPLTGLKACPHFMGE